MQTLHLILLAECCVTWLQLPLANGYEAGHCHINGVWTEIKNTQMCCNGTVEPYDHMKDCCNGRFYYKTQQICCGRKLIPRYVILPESDRRVERGCCNHQIFNVSSDEQLTAQNGNLECCGDTVINTSRHMCCRNETNPSQTSIGERDDDLVCCGHHVLNLKETQCLRDEQGKPVVKYRQERMCGNIAFNRLRQTCCLDKVHNIPYLDPTNPKKKNPRSKCCGRKVYNPQTHTCCPAFQKVIKTRAHHQCCGLGSVNTRTHLCCDGHAVQRTSRSVVCCGPQIIDPSTHSCCSGQAFNKATHYCCNGIGGQPLQKGRECCGGHELRSDQVCCDHSTPVNKTPADDKCCVKFNDDDTYTYKPYNSTLKDCTNNNLITRIAPDDRDCHGSRYLPDEAVCCNHQVHHFPPGQTLGCCTGNDLSETVFNIHTQMCCRGTFHNVSRFQHECCGDMAFSKYDKDNPCRRCDPGKLNDPHLICCNGRQYRKSIYGDSCCGRRPYSQRRSTCCNGTLYDTPLTGKECCDTELISSSKYTCCFGKPQPLTKRCSTSSRIASASSSVLRLTTISLVLTAFIALDAS